MLGFRFVSPCVDGWEAINIIKAREMMLIASHPLKGVDVLWFLRVALDLNISS